MKKKMKSKKSKKIEEKVYFCPVHQMQFGGNWVDEIKENGKIKFRCPFCGSYHYEEN